MDYFDDTDTEINEIISSLCENATTPNPMTSPTPYEEYPSSESDFEEVDFKVFDLWDDTKDLSDLDEEKTKENKEKMEAMNVTALNCPSMAGASTEADTVTADLVLSQLADDQTWMLGTLSEELHVAHQDKQSLSEELCLARQDKQSLSEELRMARQDKQSLSEELRVARQDKQSLSEALCMICQDKQSLSEELRVGFQNKEALSSQEMYVVHNAIKTLRIANTRLATEKQLRKEAGFQTQCSLEDAPARQDASSQSRGLFPVTTHSPRQRSATAHRPQWQHSTAGGNWRN